MSAVTVEQAGAIHPAQARMSPPSRFGDKAFYWLTLSMAFVVVLLVILIGWQLGQGSWLAIQKLDSVLSPRRRGTPWRNNTARYLLFTARQSPR